MSNLTRFMHKAREMIDEKPLELFNRTQWLVTEIGEATGKLNALGTNLKLASLAKDKAMTMQLNAEIAAIANQILNMNICINKEFEKG